MITVALIGLLSAEESLGHEPYKSSETKLACLCRKQKLGLGSYQKFISFLPLRDSYGTDQHVSHDARERNVLHLM